VLDDLGLKVNVWYGTQTTKSQKFSQVVESQLEEKSITCSTNDLRLFDPDDTPLVTSEVSFVCVLCHSLVCVSGRFLTTLSRVT